MAIPLKNTVYDKIKESGSITDVDLYKMLVKGGAVIAQDRYDKLLLDLEILGLIKVSWITKDERRIEAILQTEMTNELDGQVVDKDYEASFPGLEK